MGPYERVRTGGSRWGTARVLGVGGMGVQIQMGVRRGTGEAAYIQILHGFGLASSYCVPGLGSVFGVGLGCVGWGLWIGFGSHHEMDPLVSSLAFLEDMDTCVSACVNE